MTFEQIIGLSLALLVMIIGLIGSILPGLPSTPLVLAAAVAHRLYFGPAGASNFAFVVLALLSLFSLLVDYLASMFGAKKLGATWRGALGAVVGALIGLFFALPGIILGPFLGALIFEMAGGREFSEAARAGMGAVLGLLAGAIGKLACCLAMIALFTFSVVSRSGNAPDTQSVELNRSAAILAAAGWNGAMCFVVGRFRWVEPAAARMAALRSSWEGDSLH